MKEYQLNVTALEAGLLMGMLMKERNDVLLDSLKKKLGEIYRQTYEASQ